MKRALFFTLAVVLLAIAPAAAVAQTTSNGPYYAWPAWDQQLQCDSQTACPRFIVLANWRDADFPTGGAAVLDRETGLVWERSPSTTTFVWEAAHVHCNDRRTGSRVGWRLPTLQELASLVDPVSSLVRPVRLPAGHPFGNVQASGLSSYWSGTTKAPVTAQAWRVLFSAFIGEVVFPDSKGSAHFAWCVRGGHGVDPQ